MSRDGRQIEEYRCDRAKYCEVNHDLTRSARQNATGLHCTTVPVLETGRRAHRVPEGCGCWGHSLHPGVFAEMDIRITCHSLCERCCVLPRVGVLQQCEKKVGRDTAGLDRPHFASRTRPGRNPAQPGSAWLGTEPGGRQGPRSTNPTGASVIPISSLVLWLPDNKNPRLSPGKSAKPLNLTHQLRLKPAPNFRSRSTILRDGGTHQRPAAAHGAA